MGKLRTFNKVLITGSVAIIGLVAGFGPSVLAKDGIEDSPTSTTSSTDAPKTGDTSGSGSTQQSGSSSSTSSTSASGTSSGSTSGSGKLSTSPERSGAVTKTSDDQAKTEPKPDDNGAGLDDPTEKAATRLDDMKARLSSRREAIKQRLDGDRLKKCEQHQTQINTIITNGKEHAQKVLARLQSTATRVNEFYTNKNVSLDNYATLAATITDTEATAIAAVDATGSETFTCGADDASNPGGIEKDTVKNAQAALSAYRDAIRALITAISQKLEPNDTSATSEPAAGTEQSSTTTTTGGTE